jgi:hypothetical protein
MVPLAGADRNEARAALFYCCEVWPGSGLETKLLHATVKKQVDFLLRVNFYRPIITTENLMPL